MGVVFTWILLRMNFKFNRNRSRLKIIKLSQRRMAFTLLAERRKPSGERPINAQKPEGSRPAANIRGHDHSRPRRHQRVRK